MNPAPGPAKPTDSARVEIIDVLRGVAVLGILLIDITWFALPEYYADAFRNNPGDPNFWLRSFLIVFVEGKMRGLFGILFGAGILLFTARKEAAGLAAGMLYYRRMFWLALFGVFHAHVLLWRYDVLFYYAIAGMLLYPLRQLSARWLILLVVPIAMVIDVAQYNHRVDAYRVAHRNQLDALAVQKEGRELTPAQKDAITQWRGFERSLIPSRADADESTRKLKGTYSSAASRIRPLARMWQTKLVPALIWDSIVAICLGMALLKTGFLSGKLTTKAYQWIAVIGYGVGLPLALWRFHHELVVIGTPAARLAFIDSGAIDWTRDLLTVQRIVMGLGHVAIVILAVRAGWLKRMVRPLAAVGQMALTCYLSYTIICTLTFWGYGLNLYGELQYYQLYLVVLGIWTTLLIVAPLWMRHFYFGPLEWLWRTLTYWKWQKLVRTQPR
jgi:uncharacterized protein